MTSKFKASLLLLTASAAALSFAQASYAQDAAPADTNVGEVVVTASRIARSGFNAPTPTTVLGAAQVEARGATNVVEAINEVPAFRPSGTPAAAARGGSSSGGSFLDLRGLNGQGAAATARTLVLVDGRRHVPTDPRGLVDLNMIPSSLIERTEVVTGGASAAWGSDAVAGVVNLILKDRLNGLEGHVGYGQADEGDNKEYSASIAAGTGFLGGKGHIIVGAEYVDNKGIPDSYVSRDWGRIAYGNVALAATRPAGTPSRVIAQDVRLSDRLTPGGIIFGGPLDNIQFLPGGATSVFVPGALVGGNQMVGGGPTSNQGIYFIGGSNLVNPIERWSAMSRVNYEINDKISLFGEYSHAESIFRGFSASRRDDASLTIQRDNAFLPESIRSQMVALNLNTLTMGRVAYDNGYGFYTTRTDQDTNRFVGGLKGNIVGSWKWDAYYQYGKNHYIQQNQSTLNSNYTAAIDAVRDAGGNIVCRPGANLAAAAAGCVPFNIFGQNSPSQAAINYVRGVGINDVTTKQQVAAVNVSGEAFTLPAGPVSLAFGFEYRKEQADSRVDANSQASRYDLNNFKPIHGKYDTKEFYGETAVPLLKDVTLFKSLGVNAAIRRTDYSTSGPVTTWKIGGSWEPIDDLRFRATKSRDIRAPNIAELFSSAVQTRVAIINPNTLVSTQTNLITSGNITLTPEKADTITAGAVYQPSWLPGFRASIDYFDIQIAGVITQLLPQLVVDRCAAGVTVLCQDVTYANPQTITEVRNRQLNFNSLKTSGLDFEFSYAIPENWMHGLPGRLTVRALGSYVDKLVTTDATGPIDRVRQTVPKWSWNFQTNYDVGRLSANVQLRYICPTLLDTTLIGPDDPRYNPASSISISQNLRPAVWYVNTGIQYKLLERDNRQLQIYGVINNLFDTSPPPFAGSNPVGAVLYDVIGR
ncbi:MAG: TonB-dependent receptor, partial [Caulobacteraceae bacterium]